MTSADPTRSDLEALVADPAAFLSHPDAALRRLAVSSLAGSGDATLDQLAARLTDAAAEVRAEAAEALGARGPEALPLLGAARGDTDLAVIEAIATAYGEVGDPAAVDWLVVQARDAADRGTREAAVAALGAIGDDRAREVLIDLSHTGPPQVRRRAVVALTVYDGSDVEAAIRAAAVDGNPMVREVAEMVVGRSLPETS